LKEFDVVDAADQIIFTISKTTSKPSHTDECVNGCQKEHELTHLHKADANFEIISLYILEGLVELLLFDHVASLLVL